MNLKKYLKDAECFIGRGGGMCREVYFLKSRCTKVSWKKIEFQLEISIRMQLERLHSFFLASKGG